MRRLLDENVEQQMLPRDENLQQGPGWSCCATPRCRTTIFGHCQLGMQNALSREECKSVGGGFKDGNLMLVLSFLAFGCKTHGKWRWKEIIVIISIVVAHCCSVVMMKHEDTRCNMQERLLQDVNASHGAVVIGGSILDRTIDHVSFGSDVQTSKKLRESENERENRQF